MIIYSDHWSGWKLAMSLTAFQTEWFQVCFQGLNSTFLLSLWNLVKQCCKGTTVLLVLIFLLQICFVNLIKLIWLIYFYQPHFGGFILVASLLLSSYEEVYILGNDVYMSVSANICKYNFVSFFHLMIKFMKFN